MTSSTLLPPESDQRFDIGSTADSLDRMRDIYAQLGDAYRVYAPGRQSHTWVFNHPDDVRRILISNHRNYTKGVGFDRIKILLGNGIIVSEGEFWKRQRRMMQPTFHRRILAQFDRRDRAAPTTACWPSGSTSATRGEPVNVTDDMSKMTLEIILRRHLRRRPRCHGAPRPARIRSPCSPTNRRATCASPTSSASWRR